VEVLWQTARFQLITKKKPAFAGSNLKKSKNKY